VSPKSLRFRAIASRRKPAARNRVEPVKSGGQRERTCFRETLFAPQRRMAAKSHGTTPEPEEREPMEAGALKATSGAPG